METWREVEEGYLIQGWLDEQLKREGHVELPWAAGLARGDIAPRPRFRIPTLEEIRPCFANEETYQAFLGASDYNCGFADVTDAQYEERAEALEAALKKSGRRRPVEKGTVLRLESVPHEFLKDAPLLENEWIDRHVVALAEWGALLARRGFRLEPAKDDHMLAYSRTRGDQDRPGGGDRETPGSSACGPRRKTRLEAFPGRTRTIEGRPYLSLSDYLAWKGRGVKGDLKQNIQSGFVRQSFNDWVESQGTGATLAGVSVEVIHSWSADFPREVVPEAKLPQKLGTRRELLG